MARRVAECTHAHGLRCRAARIVYDVCSAAAWSRSWFDYTIVRAASRVWSDLRCRLMNEPGPSHARRVCCEVLFKAFAPLCLLYIFTTHKPTHVNMRILLCAISRCVRLICCHTNLQGTQNKDCRRSQSLVTITNTSQLVNFLGTDTRLLLKATLYTLYTRLRLIESYPALMAACSRLQPVERSNIKRSIIMSQHVDIWWPWSSTMVNQLGRIDNYNNTECLKFYDAV